MFDLLIKNGTIVDGSGEEGFTGDLAVSNGRIARISKEPMSSEEAWKILDATGKIVSPGFIDIHTHSDWSPLKYRDYSSKFLQGITLEITGNCGGSIMPFLKPKDEKLEYRSVRAYREALNKKGILNNYGVLVGHGTLREAAMGYTNRKPSSEELEKMKVLLREMLHEGAFGMSLGLIYPPSAFSEKEELLELSKVLREEGGILTVHMRNEGPRILEAVKEVLEISRESGVQLQISHLKLMGRSQWGRAEEVTKLIEDARREGVRVYADQYPYLASNTSLSAVVPKEYFDGGRKALYERLCHPTPEMLQGIGTLIEERGGAETILIVAASGHPEYKNSYLSEIAGFMHLDPVSAAVKILVDTNTYTSATYCCINEADMLHIMSRMYVAVGSDGTAFPFSGEGMDDAVHPRYFGTFPRFLETVREHRLMPLEKAVYKCTGLPGMLLGLKDRGLLQEGMVADIVIFDPDTVGSRADFKNPRVKPTGIDHIIVNGRLTADHGEVLLHHEGRVLSKGEA